MAFDQAAIKTLFARVVSPCAEIGVFRSSVLRHEPKAAPSSLPALALWWSGLGPARGFSGLTATSARIEFSGRIYVNYRGRPEDDIDADLMSYTSQVLAAFSGAFTLDGDVAFIDLLGGWGDPLSAQPGWIEHDGAQFRVAQLAIPLIADDVWSQSP